MSELECFIKEIKDALELYEQTKDAYDFICEIEQLVADYEED